MAAIAANIELDQEMGEAALEMLERVLAGEFPDHAPWSCNENGDFVKELEDITLCYQTRAKQLTMTAHLSRMASAEAKAATELSGVTIGEIAFAAIGHYYDDGWKERTKEKALQEAQQQVEIRLDRALHKLHEEQQQEKITSAKESLQNKAQTRALEKLEKSKLEVRDALREQLQVTLTKRRQEAFYTINKAVGEAYRQTLCKLVLDNGGRIISDRQSGSVIDLELEI